MAFSLKQLSVRSRTALQSIGLFLLIAIGIILLIFFTPVVQATQRVQAIFYAVSQGAANWTDNTFFARESLKDERDFYQDIAQRHTYEASLIHELERQVAELQAAVAYQATTTHQVTVARVLSRSLNEERELLIDKGLLDGIIVGEAVIVGDSHLIGIVSDLNNHTAVIRLLADSESSVAAAILGSEKTAGLIEGREGYLLSMQFIPQGQRIDVGNVVATSGLDELIPSGLIIGVVSELITNDAAAFQEARVEPIVQENDVSFVSILKIPL